MNLEDVLDDADSCANLTLMRINNDSSLTDDERIRICQCLVLLMEITKGVPNNLNSVVVFVREAKTLLDDFESITRRIVE